MQDPTNSVFAMNVVVFPTNVAFSHSICTPPSPLRNGGNFMKDVECAE